MNTYLVIGIIVYLLSAFGWWKYVQISHSKGGRWQSQTPGGVEIIVTFLPMFNTIWAIMAWISDSPKKVGNSPASTFFSVKK